MEKLIYTGPHGHIATLTTQSPASHYGVPALRLEGDGLDGLPDFGPADTLPSGITAAELVVRATGDGVWTIGDLEAAQNFCAQCPTGPQVNV